MTHVSVYRSVRIPRIAKKLGSRTANLPNCLDPRIARIPRARPRQIHVKRHSGTIAAIAHIRLDSRENAIRPGTHILVLDLEILFLAEHASSIMQDTGHLEVPRIGIL